MKNYLALLLLLAIGCNQPKSAAPEEKMKHAEMTKDTTVADLKNLVFDVKKDPVCGMPISAGISDTCTYENKLYGFCSPECKDSFLSNPKEYLTTK